MNIKIKKFVKIRIAEPLTSLEINDKFLVFGSISGYIGMFNIKNDALSYFHDIFDELIRYISIYNDRCFINIGDMGFLILDLKENLEYEYQFVEIKKSHYNLFCCSFFSFNTLEKSVNLFFPTFENIDKYKEIIEKPVSSVIKFDKDNTLENINKNKNIEKIDNFKPSVGAILMDFNNLFFIFIEYFY